MDVAGKRATVMGLGRHGGGVGAVRYLARHGAIVTVSDTADAARLSSSLAALADLPGVQYSLGGHLDVDFTAADVVVVNPAVRPGDRFLDLATAAGATTTTEIELFLRACPAPVIAVTGSVGKSTTAAMIAGILSADGRRTWLGGNIGRSLLDDIFSIQPHDWVVLELSSFQLARLPASQPRFQVAVVTNCTPNHLDWHGNFERYAAAKRRVLDMILPDGHAVLSTFDPRLASWSAEVQRPLHAPVADELIPRLSVPGDHARWNARCAAAAARAVNCREDAIARGLQSFRGLPHRLARLSDRADRRFYDDSKSTTPEATIAALAALEESIWLLAGGSEKGCDFDELAAAIAWRGCGVALYGATGERLGALVRRVAPELALSVHGTLDEALLWCWELSAPDEAILLSPACASHDQFNDYEERAAHFARQFARLNIVDAGCRRAMQVAAPRVRHVEQNNRPKTLATAKMFG